MDKDPDQQALKSKIRIRHNDSDPTGFGFTSLHFLKFPSKYHSGVEDPNFFGGFCICIPLSQIKIIIKYVIVESVDWSM
jgi:hypothetical protein